MATLSHFPAFSFLLLSPKLVFSDPHHRLKLRRRTPQSPSPNVHFAVRAASSSSVKKSRYALVSVSGLTFPLWFEICRRKAKSNEELCNELLEFIAAVGLPQGHVPSMKELSLHGRWRGCKLIRELLGDLTESESTDVDGNADNFVAENDDEVDGNQKDIVAGQDREVNNAVEEFSSLSEVSVLESNSEPSVTDSVLDSSDSVDVPVDSLADSSLQDTSSSNLEVHGDEVDDMERNEHASNVFVTETHVNSSEIGIAFNSDDQNYVPREISTNSTLGMIEELSLPTPVPVQENNLASSNIAWNLNSSGQLSIPFESDIDWSSDTKGLYRGQDGRTDNMGEEVSLSTKASIMEEEDQSSSEHNSEDVSVQSPSDLCFEEKVKKFVQEGDLDTLEDNIYGSDAEEIKRDDQFENAEEVLLRTPTSDHSKHFLEECDITAEQVSSSTTVDPALGDATSLSDLRSSLSDKDVKSEREDQQDIIRLNAMLHQKELELSRLKEQIEKEQHALSVLQANAEVAISEAQKLILEKNAELLAAEENLSGLVEVEIQYHGDGEIVEVTGSFNGWHHQIKLDPQPPSSIVDHVESRKSRQWSTMLWLYPGVYEIKFLVDGHWNIDPQRETVTRGTICNNILRVDG